MESRLLEKIVEGGTLGIILAVVLFFQGRKLEALALAVTELVTLLREHMNRSAVFVVLAVGLMFAGCAGYPVEAEACIYSERYGKICATLSGGRLKVSATVALPDELLNAGSLDELVRKVKAADEEPRSIQR